MLNPLEIEQRFQTLASSMAHPLPAWDRLRSVVDFVESLGDDLPHYESYILDAADFLVRAGEGLDPLGLSPDNLRQPLCIIDQVLATFPLLDNKSALCECRDRLRSALLESLAYAGDIRSLLEEISLDQSSEAWRRIAEHDRELSRFERIKHILATLEELSHPAAAELRKVFERWKEYLSEGADTVFIPVIEHGLGDRSSGTRGSLRRVALRITGTVNAAEDVLDAAVALFGAEPSRGLFVAPVRAARLLLHATAPRSRNTRFGGIFSFDRQHVFYEGESGDVAIAALFYTVALRFLNQRTLYRIRPSCVLTGVLDDSGAVHRVDPAGLPMKIQAAFFSFAETLVVPVEQLDIARRYVERLSSAYPDRLLEIVGIHHLRDVFFDLRVIEQKIIPRSLHLTRRLLRHKERVVAAMLIITLTAVLGKMVVGVTDRNAVSAEYAGTLLVLKNVRGEEVSSIPLNEPTLHWSRVLESNEGLGGSFAFVDLDRDGINEVVLGKWFEDSLGVRSEIVCHKPGVEAPLWRFPVRKHLIFPKNTSVTSDDFLVNLLWVGDCDGDGIEDLVFTANHVFFPSIIGRLDIHTGREVGSYVHIGHLRPELVLADLNDDGTKEIVAGGMNQHWGRPSVAVLDPRRLSGHSPTGGRYVLAEEVPASEIMYLIIPRTVVGDAFAVESPRNSVSSLHLHLKDGQIRIGYDDAGGARDRFGRPRPLPLFLVLGFTGLPLELSSGEGYDVHVPQLYREARIPFVPDAEYLREQCRKILYWDGERLRTTPLSPWWPERETTGIARHNPRP